MKNIYIVNYKETEIDVTNLITVNCGSCDFAYADEAKAIEKVTELAKAKMAECRDKLGYDEDDIDSTTNENGDYQCVTCCNNTYEYNVLSLGVIE